LIVSASDNHSYCLAGATDNSRMNLDITMCVQFKGAAHVEELI